MNIALPALLITFIITPGILFNYFYRKGFWKSPISIQSFQSEIITGVILSVPFHLCAILLGKYFYSKVAINFDHLLILLTGWPSFHNDERFYNVLSSISEHQSKITFYTLFIFVTPVIIGLISHEIVRSTYLDLRYAFPRFDNEWFYIFSGEKDIIEIVLKARSSIKKAKRKFSRNVLVKKDNALIEKGKIIYKIKCLCQEYLWIDPNNQKEQYEELKRKAREEKRKLIIIENFIENYWYYGIHPFQKWSKLNGLKKRKKFWLFQLQLN